MPTSNPIASVQPVRPGELFARVDSAAHEAATSPYSREYPTAEQLEANRYRTGVVDVQGLPLRIETPRGAVREKPGKFSNLMAAHYGDIAGTRGNDGDPVDVFVGPFPERPVVYVINQSGADGAFDEHKVMLGFASEADARSAYLASYSRDWDGLQSIVRATVSQLKWWLKFGDKSRPFTPEVLPYEGTPTMDKVLWNSQAEPVTKPLHAIMYELRVEDADAGLMLDSLSMADLMADPDITAAPVLDAMVAEVGRLQPKMEALKRIMEAAGATVKPTEMNISDPVRYRGVAQVMVLFTMSDGQTVSVWFHNPDTTPAKLMPLDELVSWKWMLNKKDVTIVVAPEKGRDLNPREVARRIMRLVERNSEAFKKANARTAERAAQLQALDAEIAGLETTLADLNRKIEVAKVEAEDRKASEPHYSDLTLQALVDNHGWKAAYFDGPGDAGKVVSVSREFAGVGPLGTMITPDGMRRLFAGYGKDRERRRYIELTLGDTVVGDWDGRDQDPAAVAALVNAAAEKFVNDKRAANGLPPLGYVEEAKEPEATFDDFLAAVAAALGEKAGINATEAVKLARDSNRTEDGFADKVSAEEVADQILADNKRSPNVERAYAIAERLIAFYGWSKSADNDYPEQGVNLESPRDSDRWVFLGEEGGRLVSESKGLNFNFDAELSTDAELAANIDLADFEAELDTGVDGLIGEGNEFEGKTAEFAYAAELLRKGAAAAGALVQFGDFIGSATPSMFDKATPAMPYAEVSVYGITAQIGIGGKVLARAIIDEAGKITMLKGSGGTEEVGNPKTAAEVQEIIRSLMAESAKKPSLEAWTAALVSVESLNVLAQSRGIGVEVIKTMPYAGGEAVTEARLTFADKVANMQWTPFAKDKTKGVYAAISNDGEFNVLEPVASDLMDAFAEFAAADRAKKTGETTAVMGASEGEDVPDAEDPIAIVDAAYKFDDATDDFKRFVADSVNETDYSTFATAKLMDQKVKGYGGAVSWGVEKTLDAIMTELFGADALLDSAGSKKIVVDDQVPMADRPFGAKQVAFVSWGASGGAYLVDVDREARQEFGGGVFLAPAGELPGGPRLVRLDPKGMTMQTARKGDGTPEWEEPVKVKGIKVFNLGKFTAAYRVAATMDAADVLDGVPLSVRAQVVDVPLHRRPFGAKQVAFADWGVSGGVILVEADAEDRKEFGSGVFRTGKGEMATGEHIVRIDPKGMKLYFVDNDHYQATDDVKWQTPVKLKTLAIHDLDKFNKAFGAPVMDSAGMLDAVQWDTVVGTIKHGGKVVGRAHIGGDGKAMIFVGAAGDKRVQYLSKFDGQIRDRLWSDDDAPLMVDDLFTLPVNGVATEQQGQEEQAPADNDLTRLNALKKLVSKDAISKDDPRAIEKIKAKLDYLSAYGDMMRKANKFVRKGDRAGLAQMGFTKPEVIEGLFKPDFAGRVGFPDYELSNNNSEMRRLRLRLEQLMNEQAQEAATGAEDVTVATEEQAPAAEPATTTEPAPAANPDAEFLKGMISGTVHLLDPDLVNKLEPMFEKYADDAAMMDLLNRAANAYSDAAVAAAKAALGA